MAADKAEKTEKPAAKAAKAPKAAAKPAAKKASAAPKAGAKALATTRYQDYLIKTKRSGRYWVLAKNGKTVNGADKTKILVAAKLLKESAPKPKEEATTAG